MRRFDIVANVYLLMFTAAALLLAFALGYWSADDMPYCPQEDSCTVDYRDGAWHIEEDTP